MDDELYREIILDHARAPHHYGTVVRPDHDVSARNPLCGDEVHLSWTVEDGIVRDIAFTGSGCSISQASASILCDSLIGQPVDSALAAVRSFHASLMGDTDAPPDGDASSLLGVKEYPARVKCALLAWNLFAATEESA